MATRAARATRRTVIEHANRTATGTNLALQVSTQIGLEWRTFANLSLFGRLRWLLTGRVTHAPRQTAEDTQIVANAIATAAGEKTA